MNDNKPLLSIIIPVFNRQKGVNALIDTLSKSISQNGVAHAVEIIVIDDASDTPLTLPETPCKCLLKRNSRNLGAPFSRTRGLLLANGKFIHFHDSDDSVSENWLKELLDELQQHPDIDLLVTGRVDYEKQRTLKRFPTFYHRQVQYPKRILKRLIYWNCIGAMGGVTFSKSVLETIKIRRIASCQDWQMYIDVLKRARKLSSRPDIKFFFHKTGNDRISHNPRKKILGHLQLAKQTQYDSIYGKNIRLFYLYACKQYILKQGGYILKFYKKHQLKIFLAYIVIAAHSFMPQIMLRDKK